MNGKQFLNFKESMEKFLGESGFTRDGVEWMYINAKCEIMEHMINNFENNGNVIGFTYEFKKHECGLNYVVVKLWFGIIKLYSGDVFYIGFDDDDENILCDECVREIIAEYGNGGKQNE